ncbi:MAG: hypothetical protein LC099_00890 [Anaerolineales bacterium]|nr:hypothetical protein [Anaerolineales bacterium]
MKKKWSIFLALFALLAAQLACAVGGEPTLSNVRTAKDEDGKQTTTTFGELDTVYIVADLANAAVGNNVTARLYVDKVDGYDHGYFGGESSIDITTTDVGLVYFYFEAPDGGWAKGSFYVEVYFNGTLNSTVNFTIQ